MSTSFTPFEYVLIDIASQFGLDKLTFEERIAWTKKNIENLEKLGDSVDHWKEKPLYNKAVQALRDIQNSRPTGHLVGLDAVNSGMQILSCLSGCLTGATNTGLIRPFERSDAYTACTQAMKKYIPTLEDSSRADIKAACMTMLYGSKKVPEKLFGEGTPELTAFYKAMNDIAPGPCTLIDVLRYAWQADALNHTWLLPDGHTSLVPVMKTIDCKIEVDELEHHKFNYRYKVNQGSEKGLSLIANVTHSIDAWVLRSLVRRCHYDQAAVEQCMRIITDHLTGKRNVHDPKRLSAEAEHIISRYSQHFIVDLAIVPYLSAATVHNFSQTYLKKLYMLLESLILYPSFDVVCVHDEFKCSPVHMDRLRFHYRNILADLAESTLLNDVLNQITGKKYQHKKSHKIANRVRNSNYAIC